MTAVLGLGTGALGNLYRVVTEDDAFAVVEGAIAAGVALIDTAPYYGHGLAERRLGAALARLGARPKVSTKVGRRLEPLSPAELPPETGFVDADRFKPVPDYTAEGVRRSLDESRKRLGVERVDVVLMHDLGRMTWGVTHERHLHDALQSGFPKLAELRSSGEVGAIGLGVNEVEIADQIVSAVDVNCVLLANRHTLLDRSAQDAGFFERCAAKGVEVMLGGVFNSGLLAAPASAAATFEYHPAPERLRQRALELQEKCRRFDVPLGAAALAFCRRTPAVSHVLVGPRTAAELHELLDWWQHPIPDDLWDEIAS